MQQNFHCCQERIEELGHFFFANVQYMMGCKGEKGEERRHCSKIFTASSFSHIVPLSPTFLPRRRLYCAVCRKSGAPT